MEHEPRTSYSDGKVTVNCDKLGWAHYLGGMESQEISRAGQTVLARLTESQIWHPPAGSVALWEEGSEKKQ